MYYFVDASGNPNGPHALGDLIRLDASGTINNSTLVCAEGDAEWKTWEQVKPKIPSVSLTPSKNISKVESVSEEKKSKLTLKKIILITGFAVSIILILLYTGGVIGKYNGVWVGEKNVLGESGTMTVNIRWHSVKILSEANIDGGRIKLVSEGKITDIDDDGWIIGLKAEITNKMGYQQKITMQYFKAKRDYPDSMFLYILQFILPISKNRDSLTVYFPERNSSVFLDRPK